VLKCMVLLAEDFDDTRDVYSFYLRREGFTVHAQALLARRAGGDLRRVSENCKRAFPAPDPGRPAAAV